MPLAYGVLISWLLLSGEDRLRPYFPLLSVSLEFLTGSLLFGLYRNANEKLTILFQKGLDVMVLLMVAGFFAVHWYPAAAHSMLLFFPCIILGLTAETSLFARCCSTPIALWFGNISYALYMTHAIALKILTVTAPMERFTQSSAALRFGVLMLYLGAIIALAAGFYYLVEFPSRNMMRRLFQRFAARKS